MRPALSVLAILGCLPVADGASGEDTRDGSVPGGGGWTLTVKPFRWGDFGGPAEIRVNGVATSAPSHTFTWPSFEEARASEVVVELWDDVGPLERARVVPGVHC